MGKKEKSATLQNTIAPSEESREPAKKQQKIKNSVYEKELFRLQVELVKLQEWIKHKGLKVVVIFEGRDAAGKGGVIKRISQYLNPRVCRIAALPAPTERETTQWYFQRGSLAVAARPPVTQSE